jgi:hypothetical protein
MQIPEHAFQVGVESLCTPFKKDIVLFFPLFKQEGVLLAS